MKVVELPKKAEKISCCCPFVYRVGFSEEQQIFVSEVAHNTGEGEPEHMVIMSGFETETEAQAAAWGFIEALHFMHNEEDL